jgi:D-3-phosphoglycerate dehydrogenase
MFRIRTYNRISDLGLARFTPGKYELGEDLAEPHAYLLRSQNLHGEPVPDSLVAVARAGAGVNNIPVEAYTHRGIVVFIGANANAVKGIRRRRPVPGSRTPAA